MGVSQLVPRYVSKSPSSCSEGCVWVRVRGRFIPDLIEARAGERLRLVFRREEIAPCSERVVIASLGKSVMLPPFEDVAVDFGRLAENLEADFFVQRPRQIVNHAGKCLDADGTHPGRAMLGKISSARFTSWVRPDEEVSIYAEISQNRPTYATANCFLEVDGKKVSSAELFFVFAPHELFAAGYRDEVLETFRQAQPLK